MRIKIARTIVLTVLMLLMAGMCHGENECLPQLRITLKGITLEEIKAGNKETRYGGNEVEIRNGGDAQTFTDVEIKGRGNTTWNCEKKPYQIKFSEKTDVLGLGKAKKWVLLADWYDLSHMRNAVAFQIAKALDMPGTPDGTWVEVYVDGQYEGLYFLCEKVEIGKERLNLTSSYGVLVEIDSIHGENETEKFISEFSQVCFIRKDAVNKTSDAAFEVFRKKLNEFEALLYAEKQDWEKIRAMIDVDSFINMYFLQELSENVDVCLSSFYMYMDGEDDVIHLGPCWDFDRAFGNFNEKKGELGGDPHLDYILRLTRYRPQSADWFRLLFRMPEFRNLAVESYRERIRPVFRTAADMVDGLYTKTLESAARADAKRWNITKNPDVYRRPYENSYHGEVRYLKAWIAARTAYMNQKYSDAGNIRP